MTADSSEMVRTRESGREREEARRGKRGEDKRESRKISSAIKHQEKKEHAAGSLTAHRGACFEIFDFMNLRVLQHSG